MRYIIIVCFLLVVSLTSSAQKSTRKVSISWTNYSKKNTNEVTSVISSDDKGFYVLSGDGIEEPKITYYNKNMEVVAQKNIGLEGRIFDFIIMEKGNLLVFSSEVDQEQGRRTLFLQKYNKETFVLEEAIILLAVDCVNPFQANYNFSFERSETGQRIAIFHKPSYMSKQFLSAFMFDQDYNLLWKNRLNLKYQEGLYDLVDIKVDDRDNLFLLGTVREKNHKYVIKGRPSFYHEILTCNNIGIVSTTLIKDNKRFIHSPKLALLPSGVLKFTGLYSNKNMNWAKGFYCKTFNPFNDKTISEKYSSLATSTITTGFSKVKTRRYISRDGKGGDVELKHFKLNEVFPKDDGGIIAVAEQRFVTDGTSFLIGGATRKSKLYHYNDILVMHINKEGNIVWADKIPKKQISTDDFGRYSSYVITVANEKMYFIFNDNPKNVFQNQKENKKVYRFSKNKDSLVVLVELDNMGVKSKESLFNFNDSFIKAIPKVSRQISDGRTILVGDSRGKNWYGEVDFKNF